MTLRELCTEANVQAQRAEHLAANLPMTARAFPGVSEAVALLRAQAQLIRELAHHLPD